MKMYRRGSWGAASGGFWPLRARIEERLKTEFRWVILDMSLMRLGDYREVPVDYGS